MKVSDRVKLYYDKKIKCPKCLSKDLVETQITILDIPDNKEYIDRKNKTACKNCLWQGVIDDLKS